MLRRNNGWGFHFNLVYIIKTWPSGNEIYSLLRSDLVKRILFVRSAVRSNWPHRRSTDPKGFALCCTPETLWRKASTALVPDLVTGLTLSGRTHMPDGPNSVNCHPHDMQGRAPPRAVRKKKKQNLPKGRVLWWEPNKATPVQNRWFDFFFFFFLGYEASCNAFLWRHWLNGFEKPGLCLHEITETAHRGRMVAIAIILVPSVLFQ